MDGLTLINQDVKFIGELKSLFLEYFVSIGAITIEECDTAIFIPFKDLGVRTTKETTGFCLYIDCNPTVASSDLFNMCHSDGKIKLFKVKNNNNVRKDWNNTLPKLNKLLPPEEEPHFSATCSPVSDDRQTAQETAGELPSPALPTLVKDYKLSSNCDKIFTLTVYDSKKSKIPSAFGCKITTEQKKGGYNTIVEKEIKMGAKKKNVQVVKLVLCQEQNGRDTLRRTEMDVLQIDSLQCYLDEIYIRGQMGPSKELDSDSKALRIKNIKVPTYIRHIVFSGFIFEVDFYDYYIYGIVGTVYQPILVDTDPDYLSCQWPWHDDGKPIQCPYNGDKVVRYKDLAEGIEDVQSYFSAFSNLNNGQFYEPIRLSNGKVFANKRVLQLCLALGYSEVIRNLKALKYNSSLLCHQHFVQNVCDLKEAVKLHPMNALKTFQGRKTGHDGHTPAASDKESAYEKFLELLTCLSSIPLNRAVDGDPNQSTSRGLRFTERTLNQS